MSVKRVITVLLLLVLVCSSVVVFASCEDVPSNYTLEQHAERMSKYIEGFVNSKYRNYTGYTSYPLYNSNDELAYFLIEFEPYGYAIMAMFSVTSIPLIGESMYELCEMYSWQRYRLCADGEETEPFEGKQWLPKKPEYSYNQNKRYEVDEEGQFITYYHSPYSVSNVLAERMYLLDVGGAYVPAIKQSGNGRFFNLVSMEEFAYETEEGYYEDKYDYIVTHIPTINLHFHRGIFG